MVEIRVRETQQEVGKRALLAWSYLGWFHYAGYTYAASPGAMRVRQIILDAAQPLPTSVVYSRSGAGEVLPFPRPEPICVVLARSDQKISRIADIESFLGLGMWWGNVVVVVPFANDLEGRTWERTAQAAVLGQTPRVREMNLRTLLGAFQPRGLRDQVVVEMGGTDERLEMSHRFSAEEVAAIAAGQSPFRIDPPRTRP